VRDSTLKILQDDLCHLRVSTMRWSREVVSDYDVYHHSLVCRAADLVGWAAVQLARRDRRHHSNEISRQGNLPISTSQVSNRCDSGQCGDSSRDFGTH
jgi:hypothetical protein